MSSGMSSEQSDIIGIVERIQPFERVAIYMIRRMPDGGRVVYSSDGLNDVWLAANDYQTHPEPTIRLDERVARELYAALGQFYGPDGHDHPRQLRADYDKERARVDKLTDALLAITAGRTA